MSQEVQISSSSRSGFWKQCLVVVTGLTATAGLIAGVIGVMNSDLFLVRVVEVSDLAAVTPLASDEILRIANVPTEGINLFSLKLLPIEQRLVAHPWIRSAVVTKRFPNTVSISVQFRDPIAILQTQTGDLFFLDQDGAVFSELNLKSNPDLPVILETDEGRKNQALDLVRAWENAGLKESYPIASIEDLGEKGFRALITYPLKGSGKGRTWVEVGQKFDGDFKEQLGRLHEVLSYVQRQGISARQVLADLGKKIVVRIARRS